VPIVTVENLHKRYGDTVAVDDVSFTVEEGEIFGILGPNGAGKTTTVEAIAGLRTPDRGRIEVLGLDPIAGHGALTEQVGVQLQASELPEKLQVGEALELYSSFYRAPADWRQLADALGLSGRLATRYGQLSGGQRQRLSIALALVGAPRLAILDELTTGLDPAARRETWALIEGIRDRGVTILLVTHFMEEAERLADRVALIDAGRVVAIDTPAALAEGLGTATRFSFRPSHEIDEAVLTGLPEVASVARDGDRLVVTGSADAIGAVTYVLGRDDIRAEQLRVDAQARLEDAFVELTGSA
jgi:ABC-2 type transport system ATP-binding protein